LYSRSHIPDHLLFGPMEPDSDQKQQNNAAGGSEEQPKLNVDEVAIVDLLALLDLDSKIVSRSSQVRSDLA